MKIAIAGIGGIGGFFGGLLAKEYAGRDPEIIFLARGRNEKVIRENGLKLETMNENFTVHPAVCAADASAVGIVDLLILCTKAYDLADAVTSYRSCIGSQTILLPLLNGVDAKESLEKIFPVNEIWQGCVYLVSRLPEPGLVRETGNIRKLFFGLDGGNHQRLAWMEKIFLEAGIEATWSKNITATVWEKFLFISPMATLTSYLDESIGAVFSDAEHAGLLQQLVMEIKSVADAKGIVLPDAVTQSNIDKLRKLPFESTTSMHSDFKKGGRTELESLTGYVIREAKKLHIAVPVYELMYEDLRLRSAS